MTMDEHTILLMLHGSKYNVIEANLDLDSTFNGQSDRTFS